MPHAAIVRQRWDGLKVMQDYLDLLNRENAHKISFTIHDLQNEGKASGIKVEIKIPEKFNFRV